MGYVRWYVDQGESVFVSDDVKDIAGADGHIAYISDGRELYLRVNSETANEIKLADGCVKVKMDGRKLAYMTDDGTVYTVNLMAEDRNAVLLAETAIDFTGDGYVALTADGNLISYIAAEPRELKAHKSIPIYLGS